jgi:methionyl-tRNA synthetase
MLNIKPVNWTDSGRENLPVDLQLNNAEILFPKIEDEIIEKQMEKLGNSEAAITEKLTSPKESGKKDELISYDEFMKVQLKVAEVVEAEKVEKSEKLLKLKIRLNNEERQVIAGIAKSYSPEEIKGKKVVIVANLKPANLMGFSSEVMILAVENESGKMEVLSVDSSVKDGTRVK